MNPVPPTNSSSALILGAGMAGLVAAYELLYRGFQVTVLEAQGTAGGRIRTFTDPFPPGVWAEAGALFIHGDASQTIAYARMLGVPLENFEGFATMPCLYFVKGQRIKVTPGSNQQIDWPYPLTPAEQKMGLDGMQTAYCSLPKLFHDQQVGKDWPPAAIVPFDQVTFDDFMRQNGASDGAVELLSVGFNSMLGDGPKYYSALMMMYDAWYRIHEPKRNQVIGGNENLPRAFACLLADQIHFNRRVAQIQQDPSKVTVITTDGSEYSADFAVCTIPYAVLRNIPVTPPFSAEKQNVIQNINHTDCARVILEFKRAFWLDEGLNGLVITDIEKMVVYPQPGEAGPASVLNILFCGEGARAIAALSPEGRVDFCLNHMVQFFPQAREEFVPGGTRTIVWQADPFAGGSHPWFAPGQITAWMPAIQQPEDRIYFAGDHISVIPGWIEGAVVTAQAAAQAIAARVATANGPGKAAAASAGS